MLHSFLLIGQSNMSGRGSLDDVGVICSPRIKMFRNGIWIPMAEPIQCDLPWAGASLAASFAQCWLEDHPDEEIGLIPCSHGATALSDWQPGMGLFENAVFQTNLARKSSVLDGILWHQGESDSPPKLACSYYERFQPVVKTLRQRIQAEHIPLLIGGLGDFLKDSSYLSCSSTYMLLNKTLQSFAQQEPNCLFVTGSGLEHKGDHLHFSAVSSRVLGRRFYQAYMGKASVLIPQEWERDYAAACTEGKVSSQERLRIIMQTLYGIAL